MEAYREPMMGQQVPLPDVQARLETLRRIVDVRLHELGSGSGFLAMTEKHEQPQKEEISQTS